MKDRTRRRPASERRLEEEPAAVHGRARAPDVRADARGILALQATAGNRAVAQLLAVQRDGPEAGDVPAEPTLKLSPSSWLAHPPGEFLSLHPTLPNGVPVAPGSAVDPVIDWGTMGGAFANRRLVLGEGDRGVITEHWRRWYPAAQLLYQLPLASKLFDSPAAIMNTMTAKMIDTSLAGDQPNPVELFNREGERFGVSTHVVSVPVWKF